MKKILVIGAGLSSSYLIKYLLDHSKEQQWNITIADSDRSIAEEKVAGHSNGKAIEININDESKRKDLIQNHDLIISMLPASMHIQIAKDCLLFKRHLITASYISPEMHLLNTDAYKSGLLFLNECGLDPGIDHLSAMKIISQIKQMGGNIKSFKSFCGGLVSPEFDDNPWNYKFTWNPRNVILAGQATARYLENGELKFIPPSRIFSQTENLSIAGYGDFECYANRDSLSYIQPYGIGNATTVLRGTLRRKGYSKNWNQLIKLGLTDDTFLIHHADKLSYREFVSAFTPGHEIANLENRVCDFLDIRIDSDTFIKLKWLGLFSDEKITLNEASPAQILQNLLQQKWKLQSGELDMIVMQHQLTFESDNGLKHITSSLVVKGEDQTLTAMAKTVGLPMAIAAKLLLGNQIKARGVIMPITKEFYEPILNELKNYGVGFIESVK